MFTRIGTFVYRFRYAVIATMVAILAALGGFGLDLGKHLSQSGFFDDSAQSSRAAVLLDQTYGRNHTGDVIVLYTAPAGQTIDTPSFANPIIANLNSLTKRYPDQILKIEGSPWQLDDGFQLPETADAKRKHAFALVDIRGNDDTTVANNFKEVKDAFQIPGIDVQVGGQQAVTGKIDNTMAEDEHRMEVLAIPLVALLLFFIFGGVVAAALPLIIGGLTIVGAWGIVRVFTLFTDVNTFVAPLVSMVALGLAIDYGLFMVSRFREEIAEGYDTGAAVRRTVMTAGRTVVMSATMIVASCVGLLLFPQGFLKSIAYGAMASVALAALNALTVLPAILGILGKHVDALGLKWMRKTKTADEIEAGVWGRLTKFVMRNPLKVAIPIVLGLSLLIIPVKNLAFGDLNETLLPPTDTTRLAQQHFDEQFPGLRKNNVINLVIDTQNSMDLNEIVTQANQAPGLTDAFQAPGMVTKNGIYNYTAHLNGNGNGIRSTLRYLRSMDVPSDARVMVTGLPAQQQDSIDSLVSRLPLMIAIGVFVTTLLMFLTFGSLVLPVKAALMSALGLGSTLGMLTWVFIQGHGSSVLNFTAGPIFAPILILIIALVFGLSTDYEVFLLSRVVEARSTGASTTEAVRVGLAHTSRIITAAALILIVVTGTFVFSHLVLMQYIACGMVSALIIDATLLRMFLVPATMKLLGDDCWWAPRWMKRLQEKVGLAEPILVNERLPKNMPVVATAEPASDRLEDARTMVLPTIANTGSLARVQLEHMQQLNTTPVDLTRHAEPSGPNQTRGVAPRPELGEPQRPEPPGRDHRPPPLDRESVEGWITGLRTAPDGAPPETVPPSADGLGQDSGRHYRGSDSVSVNDLLRRDNS